MPDDRIHHDDDSVVNVETHHEASDINIRGVMWFVGVFIVFAIVTHVALYFLFKFFVQLERRNATPPLTAVATSPDTNVPPLPRLQPFPTSSGSTVLPPYANSPVTDMEDMRAREDRVLDNYGWADRTNGVAHIPIEEAKKIALRNNAFRVNSGQAAPPVAGAPAAPGRPAAAAQSPPAATSAPAPRDANTARPGATSTRGNPQ